MGSVYTLLVDSPDNVPYVYGVYINSDLAELDARALIQEYPNNDKWERQIDNEIILFTDMNNWITISEHEIQDK